MTNTLTGILLAACAGLNAYIPLLGLALADRASSSIDLSKPFDVVSSTAGIVILLVLLTIDLVIDKVSRLDHINDLVNTALRPAAGMFLVMAVTNGKGEVDEIIAMMIGLFVAGGVHAWKAVNRLRLTTRSGGTANPLISLLEDTCAIVVTGLALVFPWAGAIVAGGAGFLLAWANRSLPNSFLGGAQTRTAPQSDAISSVAAINPDE
ncbi:MAG: DUF4126 domain-containing protein [Thermomicrobiales bacterium]|nr:DUF4126 domain-containing protein [Thermomicrobiales bacterium]